MPTSTALTAESFLDLWPLRATDAPMEAGGSAASPLATLRGRSGALSEARLPVCRPVADIGADMGNDVVLSGPDVAPRHARLRLRGGVWTLTDLGSATGSWVDGAAVTGEALLAPGSAVRLGSASLVFDPEDRWQDSPPDHSSERPPLLLVIPEEAPSVWPTTLFLLAVCAFIITLFLLFRTA